MPPARSTVTSLPATGLPSEAQLVASSSSISLARLMPSPDAEAPAPLDARLVRIFTWRSRTWPGFTENEATRAWPWPGACAIRLYVPGTSCTWSVSGVAGSVSATGTARAW